MLEKTRKATIFPGFGEFLDASECAIHEKETISLFLVQTVSFRLSPSWSYLVWSSPVLHGGFGDFPAMVDDSRR